jgi:hypothetical protein
MVEVQEKQLREKTATIPRATYPISQVNIDTIEYAASVHSAIEWSMHAIDLGGMPLSSGVISPFNEHALDLPASNRFDNVECDQIQAHFNSLSHLEVLPAIPHPSRQDSFSELGRVRILKTLDVEDNNALRSTVQKENELLEWAQNVHALNTVVDNRQIKDLRSLLPEPCIGQITGDTMRFLGAALQCVRDAAFRGENEVKMEGVWRFCSPYRVQVLPVILFFLHNRVHVIHCKTDIDPRGQFRLLLGPWPWSDDQIVLNDGSYAYRHHSRP